MAFDDQRYDIGYAFVNDLARLYADHLGGHPTLEELAALLEVELAVSGRHLVSGLEARSVTQVAIRTKRAPRDQPFAPRDVFAVPLGEGRVAFGRVMRIDQASGVLIEFFQGTAPTLAYDDGMPASGRLFHAVFSGAAHCGSNAGPSSTPDPRVHVRRRGRGPRIRLTVAGRRRLVRRRPEGAHRVSRHRRRGRDDGARRPGRTRDAGAADPRRAGAGNALTPFSSRRFQRIRRVAPPSPLVRTRRCPAWSNRGSS